MLDQFLSWVVVSVPLALSIVAIFIPAKSEDEKRHMRWRYVLVAFGLLFSIVAWWQQSRAIKASAKDRESAIQKTAQRVAGETSASVSKTVTDLYSGMVSDQKNQIAQLQHQLAAQGKDVSVIKETNAAILKVGTETASSLETIGKPRRIPSALRGELISELSVRKGTIAISFVDGNEDAGQFASDWYDVLSKAGWTIKGGINNIYTGGAPMVRVLVTIKGEPVAADQQFMVAASHPAVALVNALTSLTTHVRGQRDPGLGDNEVTLLIGVPPRNGDN